jgi:hypothetical protein
VSSASSTPAQTLVKVQKQLTPSPSPATAVVLIRPATSVSTIPIDMCPTWLSTIGPASLTVSRSSARNEMGGRFMENGDVSF